MITLLLLGAHLAQEPQFDLDVAPLLHARCATCHAGKERKGRWSLDTYERLLKPGASGAPPVVAGDVDSSELFRRLVTDDEFERMPEGGARLPDTELAAVRRWIEAGAPAPPQGDVPLVELTARLAQYPAAPERYAHPLAVTALEFSPDGATLYTSGVREVLAFDVASGRLTARHGGLPQRIQAIVQRGAAPLLVAGGMPGASGELRRVGALDGWRVSPAVDVFGDLALDAAVSPDGARFAACSADGAVGCYSAPDGSRLWRSALHTDQVTGLAFTPDGAFLVTASRDHTAKVFDAQTGALWTSYTRHTQTLPDQAMYQHAIYAVATGPGPERVVTAGEGGELHVWEPHLYRAEDGTAAQMETRFQSASHVKKVALPGGDVLAVAVSEGLIFAGMRGGSVLALDDALAPRALLEVPGDAVFSLALSRDGARLAAGTSAGRVYVWELPLPADAPTHAAVEVRPRFTVQPLSPPVEQAPGRPAGQPKPSGEGAAPGS
ncbi:MAG: c-type cytochrome domain-containing protein [Planctomycetota bacterium]